jgi:hypothetical protein
MKIHRLPFLAACITLCCLFSCSSKNSLEENTYTKLLNQENNTVSTHRWFYFTSQGFKEIALPRLAPAVEKKPWTEAIRITSTAQIAGTSYLTVNKSGILCCPATNGYQKNGIAGSSFLAKNSQLLEKYTLGKIFCIENTPVFNLYTNSRFSDNTTENAPLLIQFNIENYSFLPILSASDLNISADTYLFDLLFDGKTWTGAFKKETPNRTEFSYISFYSPVPITELKTMDPEQILETTEIVSQTYRNRDQPTAFSDAPRRLQDLLKNLPTNLAFYITHITDNSSFPKVYVQNPSSSTPLQAYCQITENCSIAIFSDGTTYFAGGLPMKYVLNQGEPIAFKLPKLPAGFSYGPMVLSGSTLYIAWEETTFYETERSGFLAVDLEAVLYGDTK